jgi:hypothetical protein
MFTVYFWVDGNSFEAKAFQQRLPSELQGTVENRKRIVNGSVVDGATYWRSESVAEVASLSEDKLGAFVDRQEVALSEARLLGGEGIVLEIVSDYGKKEAAQGVFLPASMIASLNRMGAAIDIDVVRRLH